MLVFLLMRKTKKDPKKVQLDLDQRLKTLGTFLKDARLSSGLSQNDVSRVLGLATSQLISNWETGRSSPPMKHIEKLSRIYPMNIEKLFDLMVDYSVSHTEIQMRDSLGRLAIFRKRT
jgi:transcriptional regulator with XRE-family HTH domain